jgi:hypothetical protein
MEPSTGSDLPLLSALSSELLRTVRTRFFAPCIWENDGLCIQPSGGGGSRYKCTDHHLRTDIWTISLIEFRSNTLAYAVRCLCSLVYLDNILGLAVKYRIVGYCPTFLNPSTFHNAKPNHKHKWMALHQNRPSLFTSSCQRSRTQWIEQKACLEWDKRYC